MRTLKKNKQKMYYSLYSTSTEVHDTDSSGNTRYIFDEESGTNVPVSIGTLKSQYSTPVEFSAAITSNLNKLRIQAYGVDQSAIYSEIMIPKGSVPLKIGAIIWRESAIQWEDGDTKKIPLQSSSDYTVMGLLTEYKNYDFFLLQRNTPEGSVPNDSQEGDATNDGTSG